MFLGLLCLGVLADAVWHVFSQTPPETELMGLFGLVALAGNVLAILQLLADRYGDANMAAIWLFSHREAVGNAAVVVAAALVAWLGSAWPNPVIGTAEPFLHSLGRSSAMRWQT